MPATVTEPRTITRKELAKKLNEDLAREYQAIIAYVVYSQVLKGAEYMTIASELEIHAGEELSTRSPSPSRSTTWAGCRPRTRSR